MFENFKAFFRQKDKPLIVEKSVTSNQAILQKFGIANLEIDYTDYLNSLFNIAQYNVWISACIRAITRNVAQPLMRLYSKRRQDYVDFTELKFYNIFDKPNALQTWTDFMRMAFFEYLYFGNSIIRKIYDGKALIGLVIYPFLGFDKSKIIKNIYEYRVNGTVIEIPLNEIIHWRDKTFGSSQHLGFGRLEHLALNVRLSNNADIYNIKTMEDGGEIKNVLMFEQRLTGDDIEVIQKSWDKRYKGIDKSGKIRILANGGKIQQVGQSLKDMGFESLKKLTREEVIAIFKVPPVELGLTDSINYSNAQAQRKLFWETTLLPDLDCFADTISRGIFLADGDIDHVIYFDYSNVSAMQNDLDTKLRSALNMQMLGYDNDTITDYLDIPPITNIAGEPAPSPAKSITTVRIKSALEALRTQYKSAFISNHSPIERAMRNEYEIYINEWMGQMLDYIREQTNKSVTTDILSYFQSLVNNQNDKLSKISLKNSKRAQNEIVKNMIDDYGLKYTETFRATQSIVRKSKLITRINDTIIDEYRTAIAQGISESEGNLGEKLEALTRGVFKHAKSRGQTIARTETSSIANELILDNFAENTVEKKVWLSAQDELVRSPDNGSDYNHALADGQTVKVSEKFLITGVRSEYLDYPGDPNGSAENVINCRCTMMPE